MHTECWSKPAESSSECLVTDFVSLSQGILRQCTLNTFTSGQVTYMFTLAEVLTLPRA